LHQFEIMLERPVIGQIDFRYTGRIAGTTQILEQRGIVYGPTVDRREVERLRHAAGDPATAQGMSFRLAFGKIQRIGKRAQNFAERG